MITTNVESKYIEGCFDCHKSFEGASTNQIEVLQFSTFSGKPFECMENGKVLNTNYS